MVEPGAALKAHRSGLLKVVISGVLAGCSSSHRPPGSFHNLPYPYASQFECGVSNASQDSAGLVIVTVVEAPSWPRGTATLQHWARGQPQLSAITLGDPITRGCSEFCV